MGVLYLLPDPEIKDPPVLATKLPREPVKARIRDVTPDEALPGPKPDALEIERLPQIIPPKPEIAKVAPVKRFPKPIISNTAEFSSGDRSIRFDGIKPVPLDKICEDSVGELWPCGKFARTALRALVRGRAIECKTDGLATYHHCKVGETRISLWLVENGWAHSDSAELQPNMDDAKRKKLGIWRDIRP